MGHVGYRIATLLIRLGQTVAIIYDRAPEDWVLQMEESGALCIQGDAQNERLLLKAGIKEAHAIIAATDQDMVNLSIALDSVRLHPNLVVVLRLFDQELGDYLKESLQIRQVFSTSALAAPIFSAAARGQESLGHFYTESRRFTIIGVDNPKADQQNIQNCLSLFCEEAGQVSLAPEDGTDDIKNLLAICQLPSTVKARPRRNRITYAPTTFFSVLRHISTGLKFIVSTVILVILAGILIGHFTMGLSYIDAFYFMITTVTTTGYGDVSFLNAPGWVKLFGCFLMTSGALSMTLLFGIVTDAVITHRFQGMFQNTPIHKSDHAIVIGSGHLFYRTVKTLIRDGIDVVTINSDKNDSTAIRSLGVPIIEGDPRLKSVLRNAGITTASSVLCLDDKDVVSLGASLLAKKLNPAVRTIVRVFDGVLARKLEQQLAVDCAMSLSAVSAPAFVAACLYENVVQAMVWKNCLIVLHTASSYPRQTIPADLEIRLCKDAKTGRLIIATPAENCFEDDSFIMSLHRLNTLSHTDSP